MPTKRRSATSKPAGQGEATNPDVATPIGTSAPGDVDLTVDEKRNDEEIAASREPAADQASCAVEGCGREVFSKELCAPHYVLRPDLRRKRG